MKNYIWVPFLIIFSILMAFISKKSNDSHKYWSYFLILTGTINSLLWIWLTKLSKNIIFDSMLYSIIISIGLTLTFIFMGCGSKFNNIQWIGTFLTLLGFILIKLGEK